MSVKSKLSLGSEKRRLSDREYNMELLSSNLSKLEKDLSEVFVNVELLMKSPNNIERVRKEIVSVDEIFLEIQYYFEKYIALFDKTPDEETFWFNKIKIGRKKARLSLAILSIINYPNSRTLFS